MTHLTQQFRSREKWKGDKGSSPRMPFAKEMLEREVMDEGRVWVFITLSAVPDYVLALSKDT
jgi:hypothetical protein